MYRSAWIEQEEWGGRGLRTFAAHVQEVDGPGGARFLWGPDGVPLEDALEWARTRADEVFADLGSRRFSAGAKPVASRGIEEWPGDDVVLSWVRVADPVPPGRLWRGWSRLELGGDEFARAAPGFVEALEGDPLIRSGRGSIDEEGHALEATVAVMAANEWVATSRTNAALRRAATAGGGLRDLLPPGGANTRVEPAP